VRFLFNFIESMLNTQSRELYRLVSLDMRVSLRNVLKTTIVGHFNVLPNAISTYYPVAIFTK